MCVAPPPDDARFDTDPPAARAPLQARRQRRPSSTSRRQRPSPSRQYRRCFRHRRVTQRQRSTACSPAWRRTTLVRWRSVRPSDPAAALTFAAAKRPCCRRSTRDSLIQNGARAAAAAQDVRNLVQLMIGSPVKVLLTLRGGSGACAVCVAHAPGCRRGWFDRGMAWVAAQASTLKQRCRRAARAARLGLSLSVPAPGPLLVRNRKAMFTSHECLSFHKVFGPRPQQFPSL